MTAAKIDKFYNHWVEDDDSEEKFLNIEIHAFLIWQKFIIRNRQEVSARNWLSVAKLSASRQKIMEYISSRNQSL